MSRVGVLFVCLGNICRSPLADGLFADYVRRQHREHLIEVDSAGTSGWHDGKLPDPGSIRVAKNRGLDITYQRSRKLIEEDFDRFDVIVAMDGSNRANIEALRAPREGQLVMLRDFDPQGAGGDVPDPWEKGDEAFVEVYEMVERCMLGLFDYVERVATKG